MDEPRNITVTLEPREDGGLRVYSPDMPGLILSGFEGQKIKDGILPAVATLHVFKLAQEEAAAALAASTARIEAKDALLQQVLDAWESDHEQPMHDAIDAIRAALDAAPPLARTIDDGVE